MFHYSIKKFSLLNWEFIILNSCKCLSNSPDLSIDYQPSLSVWEHLLTIITHILHKPRLVDMGRIQEPINQNTVALVYMSARLSGTNSYALFLCGDIHQSLSLLFILFA